MNYNLLTRLGRIVRVVPVLYLKEALAEEYSDLRHHRARPEYGAVQLDAVAKDLS